MGLKDLLDNPVTDVILCDLAFIITLIGVVVSVLVLVVDSLYPVTGVYMGFTEGFSMCKAENPGYDYLSLVDSMCNYAPGNILITYRMWPPKVGDIACAYLNSYGIVCHEVTKVEGNRVWFAGTNPHNRLVTYFTEEQYIGTVVGKLPRAIGYPAMAFTALKELVSQFLFKVNVGAYPRGVVS